MEIIIPTLIDKIEYDFFINKCYYNSSFKIAMDYIFNNPHLIYNLKEYFKIDSVTSLYHLLLKNYFFNNKKEHFYIQFNNKECFVDYSIKCLENCNNEYLRINFIIKFYYY